MLCRQFIRYRMVLICQGKWRQNSKYWTLQWGRGCTQLLQVDQPPPCLVSVPQLKPYIHLTANPKRERMQLSWFSSPFPNWQFVLQTGWSNISYAGLHRGFIYKEMLGCYDPVAVPQSVAKGEATSVCLFVSVGCTCQLNKPQPTAWPFQLLASFYQILLRYLRSSINPKIIVTLKRN